MDDQATGALCGTWSIAALDAASGQLGVCVASKVLAVGRWVPRVRPNVAAVCTQSWAWPKLAAIIFQAVELGLDAEAALQAAIAADNGRDVRQVTVVDRNGRTAAYTGSTTQTSPQTNYWGHVLDEGFVVAGNMIAGPETLEATARTYRELRDAQEPLHWRLLLALQAGEASGGDYRGRQSAALVVAAAGPGACEYHQAVDLRVDDHPTPTQELARMLQTYRPRGANK